ncbi:MAG TPA: chloride channel protein [Thermoanaerobaculia bacterium]|nr:chloride channel protein [Thermoanaerobaculia bacterium]
MISALAERIRAASRRFLLATQVGIGALCGLAAFVFHALVRFMASILIAPALMRSGPTRPLLVIAIPAAAAFAIALLIRRWAPGAGGANLARVRRAYGQDPRLLDFRSVTATFVLTPVSLGSGAPLGPEGPIVVVASGVSAGAARLLHLPRKVVRGMIPAGTAAGIAAIFNAPITGVVFALEEVLGTAEKGVLGGAIVAAVAAAVVETVLRGGRPLLEARPVEWSGVRALAGFAVLGVLAGGTSGLAMRAIERLRGRVRALLPGAPVRAAAGGALIGLLGLLSPQILGVGYETVSGWLGGGGAAGPAAIAFGAKTAGFVIALSCGVIGGTFAPSLFMGAALGAALGHGMHLLFPAARIDPGGYALAGMGAFFAGVLRCPIAAVLIVIEVTGDYGLVLPLMLSVALAMTVSRLVSPRNMVEHQMREEGFVESESVLDPLSAVRVGDVMSRVPIAVAAGIAVLAAARSVAGTRHHFYPVVDDEARLIGLLSSDAIDDAVRDGRTSARVSELHRPTVVVGRQDEPVRELVARLAAAGLTRCPVVAADGSGRLVGFVSPADLLEARIRRTRADGDDAIASGPAPDGPG